MEIETDNKCPYCREYDSIVQISSPSDLSKMIKNIKNAISNKVLLEIRNETNPIQKNNQLFTDVYEKGPWEDIISYNFMCIKCKRKYRITVDTYHGSGGEWAPIS